MIVGARVKLSGITPADIRPEGVGLPYISGTGFQRGYETIIGEPTHLDAQAILALEDAESTQAYKAYCDQLARGLSQLVNTLDPDVIVLGGGMSNQNALYKDVPSLMISHVFSNDFTTPIFKARHGDSSGVLGAARLW